MNRYVVSVFNGVLSVTGPFSPKKKEIDALFFQFCSLDKFYSLATLGTNSPKILYGLRNDQNSLIKA